MKKIFILFFLTCASSSFPQFNISLSAGVDPKELSLYSYTATDGDNAYWNKGISIGVNIDYSISEYFLISALFHYSHYNFKEYANTGFSIPESSFLYAEGEDSKLWRTSAEVKYFPYPQSTFKFFILSGLGIAVEDLGTVKTHYSIMAEDENRTNIIDSEIKNSFIHSLGIGVRADIISNLFIDLSGLYYSNYEETFQTFFGVNIGCHF